MLKNLLFAKRSPWKLLNEHFWREMYYREIEHLATKQEGKLEHPDREAVSSDSLQQSQEFNPKMPITKATRTATGQTAITKNARTASGQAEKP